eukprot:gene8185-1443_t
MQQIKGLLATRPLKSAFRPSINRRPVVCKAQQNGTSVGQKAATAAAAAILSMGTLSDAAIASEFDIMAEPTPTTNQFVYDDATVLSKSTRAGVTKRLKILEIGTGYHVNVVTVRRLEFETDAFAFGDKVLETWYPSRELGDKRGVVVIVTAGKEGAVSGGASFLDAIGDDLIESLVSDNIPIFTEQEKYNQTVDSVVERIEAKLNDQPVPDAPVRDSNERKRNYKTKEETDKSKSVTGSVVVTLLILACVYYGYTAKD